MLSDTSNEHDPLIRVLSTVSLSWLALLVEPRRRRRRIEQDNSFLQHTTRCQRMIVVFVGEGRDEATDHTPTQLKLSAVATRRTTAIPLGWAWCVPRRGTAFSFPYSGTRLDNTWTHEQSAQVTFMTIIPEAITTHHK